MKERQGSKFGFESADIVPGSNLHMSYLFQEYAIIAALWLWIVTSDSCGRIFDENRRDLNQFVDKGRALYSIRLAECTRPKYENHLQQSRGSSQSDNTVKLPTLCTSTHTLRKIDAIENGISSMRTKEIRKSLHPGRVESVPAFCE